MEPLLQSAGIELNSTIEDLKIKTGIDIHIITVDLNQQKTLTAVDICATTKPNMRIYDALAASLAIPMIFQPVLYEDNCYIDGGILNNYPLSFCLEAHKEDISSVLGVKNIWNIKDLTVSSETSFIEFMRTLVQKLHNTVNYTLNQPELEHEIICDVSDLSNIEKWIEVIESTKLRETLIQRGETIANSYITAHTTNL